MTAFIIAACWFWVSVAFFMGVPTAMDSMYMALGATLLAAYQSAFGAGR